MRYKNKIIYIHRERDIIRNTHIHKHTNMHCKTVALLSAAAILAAVAFARASEDDNSNMTAPKNMEAVSYMLF